MNQPTRYCGNCGKPVSAQTRFCGHCGRPVGTTPGQPPAGGGQRTAAKSGPQGAKRRFPVVWAALGGVAALAVCLAGAGIVVWLLASGPLQPGSSKSQIAPSAAGQAIETLPVVPGGMVSDSRGATLAMPAASQPEGYQASLASYEPGGPTGKELAKLFGDGLVLYSLISATMDGIGHSELTLPAPSPDSRLGVLVDGSALTILPDPPVDGKLTAYPRVTGGGGPGEPNLYVVLDAKEQTEVSAPGALKLAAPAPEAEKQTATGGVSCSKWWHLNDCRTNANKSVYVYYKVSDAPASMQKNVDAKIDDLIAKTEDIFKTYYDQGNKFSQANISSNRYVTIRVSSSYKEPFYSYKTGNIYLGWGVVENIASGEFCTLAHEIMHWVQDEQYVMMTSAGSGSESWWLEMSAMYGAYFYSPTCIETTITTYGAQTIKDKRRAYQAEPFTWASGEDARYVQGIQFYLGVCSGSGCAISQADLINAINAGSFPYDAAKQAAYTALARDTGLYMLGEPPTQGNTAAPIPPAYTTSGTLYEYILYDSGSKTAQLQFSSDSGNQFKLISPVKASVTAKIEKGGEYPFFAGNGEAVNGISKPTIPVMARVAPGAGFWAKMNNQNAIFYDGTKETLLGPIGKMGSTGVRILAVAPAAPATFSLTYETADLSGDWGAEGANVTLIRDECPDSEFDTAEAGNFFAEDRFMSLISGNGTYLLDPAKPDGSHYIWQAAGETGDAQIASDITVDADKAVLKYKIHIPKPASESSALPGAVLLGTAGTLGLAGKRRRNLLLALLVLLPLLLAGCDGFAFWGDIQGTYTFDKMSYTDPGANPGTTYPWALSGKGEIDLAVSFDTGDAGPLCHTVIGLDLKGKIGPDGSVSPPNMSDEEE